jgi:hypothetical protein
VSRGQCRDEIGERCSGKSTWRHHVVHATRTRLNGKLARIVNFTSSAATPIGLSRAAPLC